MPQRIIFFSNRSIDDIQDAETADEGDLPDANQGASHLRTLFSRMGLSDKDIVALSGGHTLVTN